MTKKKNKAKAKSIDKLNALLFDGNSERLKRESSRLKRKQEKDYYRGRK